MASFFYPYDRVEEPYIRLATGDYPKLRKKNDRDDALAIMLMSLARQIVRYQDWVCTSELPERRIGTRARRLIDRYSKTVDRP